MSISSDHLVFISYSRYDRQFVKRLASDLSDAGAKVWFDLWEMKVGDSLITKIQEAIKKCAYFIIVLSNASVQSAWVNKELNTFLSRQIGYADQKKILPVLKEDCEVPVFLKEFIYADCRANYQQGMQKILEALPVKASMQFSIGKELLSLYERQRGRTTRIFGVLEGTIRGIEGCVFEGGHEDTGDHEMDMLLFFLRYQHLTNLGLIPLNEHEYQLCIEGAGQEEASHITSVWRDNRAIVAEGAKAGDLAELKAMVVCKQEDPSEYASRYFGVSVFDVKDIIAHRNFAKARLLWYGFCLHHLSAWDALPLPIDQVNNG